ncbi:short chain dehydrogenase [Botrimarina colliarenosi]|uniref:Short chain dehydrogenase n=1 Tax=Botrimarina colliarenosi TaxID=2528001 RepID=A0A5C6ACC7_9BACT|nr:class II aldolase/adducin family protein [Botrimarina colliarenosi]TWT97664.1 short chain dehydrogenase [Botrimarina colliarenosi]
MIDRNQTLNELVELSRWLGAPERDCTILGEGNTSAKLSDETFLVKASGGELGAIEAGGFVEVRSQEILKMVEADSIPDAEVRERLTAAKVDLNHPGVPSVETPLHAICLGLPGVSFIGHGHPVAINAIVCSNDFEQALSHRLFPDQVVVCGPRSLQVPYVDPGVELGKKLLRSLAEYLNKWGEAPKTIYLRNHGFVALGSSARQVKAITQMAVKAARILAGTAAFGGPHGMDAIDIDRIHTRPDEHHRQRVMDNG